MRRALAVLAFVAFAGCSPVADRAALGDAATAPRAVVAPAASDRAEAALVARYGGAYSHPAAEALVQETFADLVRASGAEELHASVTLLNSASYNAFALPDGRLFVTRGMLALANDQAELAAALAHELGHVVARHAAERLAARAQAVSDTIDVARTFGDEEITRAAIAANQQTLAAFNRNQELEADRISIDLLARAGYDAGGALRALQALDRINTLGLKIVGVERREQSPVSSHPPTPERIAAARAAIASHAQATGKTNRERYLASIAGVAFGEDGRAGYIRGRAYINTRLGIALTAPRGYLLFGSGAGLGALKQGGKTVMIFSPASSAIAADPEEALRRLLASVDARVDIKPLSVGPAHGAMASYATDRSLVRAAFLAIGERAWRVLFVATDRDPRIDADFRELVGSLRAPGPDDEALARPLALRVERVDGLAAVRHYAGRAGDAENGAALILALNGLSGAGALRPGAALKVPGFAGR